MPLFGNQTSPLEADIEKATGEGLVAENWALNFEICDKLNSSGEKGCKEAVKLMVKRLLNKNPRVVYHTLVLMETCGKNCGREFLLNVSTREFCQEIQSLLNKVGQQPKIKNKILYLVESWHKQYASDPQFGMISELYLKFKEDPTIVFPDAATIAADAAGSSSSSLISTAEVIQQQQTPKSKSSKMNNTSNAGRTVKKEQDDLAKAIALSLKESTQTYTAPQTIPSAPVASNGTSLGLSLGSANLDKVAQLGAPSETRKVRALYDFEAVESNELTFKAGEVIILHDDSDENWWRGENHRGSGLFPAHFVTKDLDAPVPGEESYDEKASGKKQGLSGTVVFQDEVKVIEFNSEPDTSVAALEINAEKISRVQQFLDTADPTGSTPDPLEMLSLEHECYAMGPLIDEQLHQLDLEHVKLSELNKNVIDALNMYHKLMAESPAPVGFQMPSMQHPMGMYGQAGGNMVQLNGQAMYAPGQQMSMVANGSYYAQNQQPMNHTTPNPGQPESNADISSTAKMSFQNMGNIPQGDYGVAQPNGGYPQGMHASHFTPISNGSLPPQQPQSQSYGSTMAGAQAHLQPHMIYSPPPSSQYGSLDPSSINYSGAVHYAANTGQATQQMQ